MAADEDAILPPEGPAEAGHAAADGRVTWTLTIHQHLDFMAWSPRRPTYHKIGQQPGGFLRACVRVAFDSSRDR